MPFTTRFRELQYASALVGLTEGIEATTGPAAQRGDGLVAGYVDPVEHGTPEELTGDLRDYYEPGTVPRHRIMLRIPGAGTRSEIEFNARLEFNDVRFVLRWKNGPPQGYWTIAIDIGGRRIISERGITPQWRIMGEGNDSGLSGDFYAFKVREDTRGQRVPINPLAAEGEGLYRYSAFGTVISNGEYELFYVPAARLSGLDTLALGIPFGAPGR